MKFSISNIAWENSYDDYMYGVLNKYGFTGIEIAPTRIFPTVPYDRVEEAVLWHKKIMKEYQLCVSSMQSIWYGKNEKMFSNPEERKILLEYTKKAIAFAEAIECNNIVFGCPRNRVISKMSDYDIAIDFFKEIGDYAQEHNTVVAMEANPVIYNTNFINTTKEALELIKAVRSNGFRLNLDLGTMLENHEDIKVLEESVQFINHVHISEPGLRQIEQRSLHKDILSYLEEAKYEKFVSIEMGKTEEISDVEKCMDYIRGL